MKYILVSILMLGVFVCQSQPIKKTHRVVLKTDKVKIFDKEYAPLRFGESYFVCKEEYNFSFTDAGFEALTNELKTQSPEISAFRSADNKSIICVFPKLSTKGIYELHDFIAKHFEDSTMAQAKTKQTIYVQVVDTYDPLDLESEKGFNYN